jgi:hypothetical protein
MKNVHFVSGFDPHTVCIRKGVRHACGETVDANTGEYQCASCEDNKRLSRKIAQAYARNKADGVH